MHALRHFRASALLDAGESIKALASYLGHSGCRWSLDDPGDVRPVGLGRRRAKVPSVPVTRYRNSWMTSIEPTMCALNSSSSSAATHSIGAADPPKDRVE